MTPPISKKTKRAKPPFAPEALETRRRLTISAADLFARRGFSATTITDIASAAGVNRSLVSYHFGGKSGLYDALIDRAIEDANRSLSEVRLQPDAVNAEEQLIRAFAAVYTAHPHLAPMLVREHLDPDYFLDPSSLDKLRGFSELTAKVLAAREHGPGRWKADPHLVHLICVGSLIYFLITTDQRKRAVEALSPEISNPSLNEFVSTLARMLSKGLIEND